MLIYDCFTLFDELDLLKFRMSILDKYVDKFVVVEANFSFSGNEKRFNLEDNFDCFEKWTDKIIYVKISDDLCGAPNAWFRENFQRNAIERGLVDALPDDLIFISDVDEIPNVPKVLASIDSGEAFELDYKLYYYNFNFRNSKSWRKARVIKRRSMILTPNEIRHCPGLPIIPDCGWHLSYLMSPESVREKISNFSHQEYNNNTYKNLKKIERSITLGVDLFGRSAEVFRWEPADEELIDNLTAEMKKYIVPEPNASIKIQRILARFSHHLSRIIEFARARLKNCRFS